MGPFIKDIRKIVRFFDPLLPPCPHLATDFHYKIHATTADVIGECSITLTDTPHINLWPSLLFIFWKFAVSAQLYGCWPYFLKFSLHAGFDVFDLERAGARDQQDC